MNHWSFTATPPLIVLLAILWLVTGWLCWANWFRRRGTGPFLMESLRFLIVTCILFTLFQPEFVRRLVVKEEPEIVVLHDGSGSMQTRDVVAEGSNVLTRAEWLRQRLATNFWAPLEGRAQVVVEEFARPAASTNATVLPSGTDLNLALETVLERQKHLKAVLLLSDGDWNTGSSPLAAATRFRSQKTPLFTVAVGSRSPLPDLVLEPVLVPSYGLLGEQISIPVRVRSHLPREVRTTVAMTGPRGTDVRKEIVIPAFGQVQESMVWMPRAVGEYPLRLSLPVERDEYLSDNNDQTFRVAIRTEKLRVLVIDSLPRWEYRYLRNALERDPGVDVNCLLFHPGLPVGQGTNYLNAFPARREDLAQYDVVFLGDVGLGENELTSDQLTMLEGLVEQQGSGLIFLPGRRGRQMSLLKTPLDELLPVNLNETKPNGIASANESRLLLTLSGQGHFLTMLSSDEQRNAVIWKGLPGFYWCAAVEKARPGADVLAVHGNLRTAGGRMPLLVTRPYGNGEVLFMGTDSAWRWRRGVEDKYHYRFWGQVVRWMAHKRHMAQGEGFRLSYSPENPSAGESVYLQATVLDRIGVPAAEQVQARIVSPSGQAERLEFTVLPGGWGVYKGSFTPREGGAYKIEVSGERAGQKLETELTVAKPEVEKTGQPANVAMMRDLAELTRGASGSTSDLDALVQRISLLPEAEPLELRFRLWSNPWWGGAILLLLAIYWTARKAAGMI
jgi:uncharacterized membrane protein